MVSWDLWGKKIVKSDIFLVVYYYLTLFDIPKTILKCIISKI